MKDINIKVTHWKSISPYIRFDDERHYKASLIILDELIELSYKKKNKDKSILNLISLIGESIQKYEQQKYKREPSSPMSILVFLMQQHDLTQKELPELGTQSLVSKILSGKRKLTTEQIKKLSHRFNVSPAVFF